MMPSWRSRLACCGLPLALFFSSFAEAAQPSCKAVPGSPDWPSPQAWAQLNESLAGRLLQPPPPGAVCHPGQPTYNATACPAVRAAWSDYNFHAANPVSVDWNQFANDTCLPQEGAPCSPEGYPVYVVNATEARHVQLGVQFARKHNVRLVVKSSGHDYIGRSNAPNSLSIWVHNLNAIQTHASFRPSRCAFTINETAVTVGGGTGMLDLYSALDAVNQTIVGGASKRVSVGGYLTGAGHSLLSSWHGLAADQVLEMEVVTPAGDIVTANECQNTDLFWAMRGGGGSTFGILTSVTLRTFPTPPLESLHILVGTSNVSDPAPILAMGAYVLSALPSLNDAGLAGYFYFSPALATPFDGGNTTVGGFFMAAALLPRNSSSSPSPSPDDMRALWAPVLAHINATWPGLFGVVYEPATYPSYFSFFEVNADPSSAGLDSYTGSWLLDREALTGDVEKLGGALETVTANGTLATLHLVAGKGVAAARPRGGGDAVLPAWRRAYLHAAFGISAPPLDPAANLAAREGVKTRVAALKELAPDMGAYVNEADFEQPDFQQAFWGSHYQRLVGIKRALDPDDVFWCTPCVGNERWEQVGDRLCRV